MLKWYQNLISFGRPLGTRLFRPKSRQEAPAPQIAAEDEVGRDPVGEDLGGGTRTFEKKNPERDKEKEKADLDSMIPHAVPGGRRIEAPLGGVPPPNVFGVWSVAIRKGVWKKKAWRFEFS